MHGEKYGEFALSVRLGSEAMQTNADIARALREVADKVEAGQDEGGIMDDNGNSAGRFEFVAWSKTASYDQRRDG